jgi:DUF1009 family protein
VTPPIGLLAGAGRFPITVAEKAKVSGIPVVCIGVAGMADPELSTLCQEFHWLRRLSLGFVTRTLKRAGATEWTMAGKFYKHLLFQPHLLFRLLPDWKALRFWYLRHRSDNRDDSILLGLIDEFHNEGLKCVSALDLCPELLVREGVLTHRTPTASELRDIQFGWTLAREMGRLDIGQSVMIRNRCALAVEAIEGTDAAIQRAGELSRKAPFVVVKVAKPNQDMRFDVPTVGTTTIESMKRAGATVLAVEAGRTIFIDEADTIALANNYGIAITAMTGG